MSRAEENTSFRCINCLKHVQRLDNGSYRNHCPFCLASLHVDEKPGDRKSLCHGLMLPIALQSRKGKWQLIHRCQKCGVDKANKTAEMCAQPDDLEAILVVLRSHL